MTIAVDFDGTIVEHKYPEIGKEIPFAIDTLKRFVEAGHKVVLWSVREGKHLDEAVEYCHDRGLDFYAVNSEYPNASWSESGVSRKLKADVYIDDRNVGGIPDWGTIYEMVSGHMNFNDILTKAMAGDDLPAGFNVYDGTFNRPHHHHKKKNIFQRIKERTRSARARYRR